MLRRPLSTYWLFPKMKRVTNPRVWEQPRQKLGQGGSLMHALTQKVKPEPASAATIAQPQGNLNALLGNRLAQQAQQKSDKTLWKRLEERISGPRVIINLLQRLAKRQPLLLILEDIHWLDRESEALLNKLVEQLSPDFPLMFVLTARQPLEEHDSSLLEVAGLSESALTQVAQRALGGRTLDSSLARWICKQANGNPLYAEELCHALQQANTVFLDRESGEVRWTKLAPALPLSLHELLLARLDELPYTQQAVLKRAAVIGDSFEAAALLTLCQERMGEREASSALERITQAGFITEIRDDAYRFNHPLMQEAIYATLSFSQRQEWHTKIGNWLIEYNPEQFLELIAYHHLLGTDLKKAAKFTRLSGNKAKERQAYAGALEYYEQVLALENIPDHEIALAAESKADVLALQKDYSTAAQAYNHAIELGSDNASGKRAIVSGSAEEIFQTDFTPPLQAWAKGSQAWLLAINGQHEAALRLAQAAVELADPSVKATMESLTKSLLNSEDLGPYEEWLQRFAQSVLFGSS